MSYSGATLELQIEHLPFFISSSHSSLHLYLVFYSGHHASAAASDLEHLAGDRRVGHLKDMMCKAE